MQVKIYNQKLESSESMDLNPKIYGIKPVAELINHAVRVQMANNRSGISHTKTRGEVRGGGRKPWKQKGTGQARAGSIRSPIWRHGGVAFGPRGERNYSLKMNKKEWRKALYMTLSDKVSSDAFLIFSELEVKAPKTKEMAAWLSEVKSKLNDTSKKFLFVLPAKDDVLEKSTRNLKNAKVIRANSLNVLDIIESDSVIIPKKSLEIIEKTYLK